MFDAPLARGGDRANRERRLDGLAVDVLVALRVRDTTVADAERLSGAARRAMTEREGLSLRDAVEWCGRPG